MAARQYADAAATQRHPLKKLSHALAAFATAQPQTIYLRDGEVIVYRRSRSLLYRCRYKLADGLYSWSAKSKVLMNSSTTMGLVR